MEDAKKSEELNIVFKRSWWKGLIVTGIIVGFYVFGKVIISLDSFDPVNNVIENYNLSDLYFHWHERVDASKPYIIVDISDIHNRSEIAALLEKIDSVRPKVIGLDVFFSQATKMPQEENESLVRVLQEMQTPLVAASLITPIDEKNNTLESSYFISELRDKSTIYEGVIDFPRDSRTVRAYRPVWKLDGDTIYSFAKQIADLAGIPMPSDTNTYLISYAERDTTIYKSKELENFGMLKNRVVLVGDFNDKQDMFPIPVTLNASRYCPGVEIHKQILSTADSGWNPRKAHVWLEICISFLVIWIFCMIAYFLGTICDGKWKIAVIIMSAVFILLAVVIGDYLFWSGTYFSMKYILVGMALSSTALDIVAAGESFLNAKKNKKV